MKKFCVQTLDASTQPNVDLAQKSMLETTRLLVNGEPYRFSSYFASAITGTYLASYTIFGYTVFTLILHSLYGNIF